MLANQLRTSFTYGATGPLKEWCSIFRRAPSDSARFVAGVVTRVGVLVVHVWSRE